MAVSADFEATLDNVTRHASGDGLYAARVACVDFVRVLDANLPAGPAHAVVMALAEAALLDLMGHVASEFN